MENRIKELRQKAGITQEKLAEMLDTSKSMVSFLESGERRLNSDWIKKLCDIFNVGPGQVFKSETDYNYVIIQEKIERLREADLIETEKFVDYLLSKQAPDSQRPR